MNESHNTMYVHKVYFMIYLADPLPNILKHSNLDIFIWKNVSSDKSLCKEMELNKKWNKWECWCKELLTVKNITVTTYVSYL